MSSTIQMYWKWWLTSFCVMKNSPPSLCHFMEMNTKKAHFMCKAVRKVYQWVWVWVCVCACGRVSFPSLQLQGICWGTHFHFDRWQKVSFIRYFYSTSCACFSAPASGCVRGRGPGVNCSCMIRDLAELILWKRTQQDHNVATVCEC